MRTKNSSLLEIKLKDPVSKIGSSGLKIKNDSPLGIRLKDPVTKTRIEGLTNVWSSLAVASGRLYVVGRDGKTAVIELGPEYELLALNELDDNVDASPVFVGERLYLRGRERLYALEGSAE